MQRHDLGNTNCVMCVSDIRLWSWGHWFVE